MGTPTTKNLGLVKAIHVGNNPPINTQMLWYNTNPMVNQHYYYDVITTSWVSLTSGSIAAINVSYDNTTSLLAATNVQDAIDELDAILDSLSFTAANISYDNSGSGLTAINVQNAIDEVLGLIPTVSYPVTGASNGTYLSGTTVKLGTNPLTENTTVTTAAFYLDLFGNLRFRPSTLSSTSQNKSVQLANTTGAVSLVNKGCYCFKEISFNTVRTVTIPVADGLVLDIDTTVATNFNTLPTNLLSVSYQFSSRINNSGSDDYINFINFFTTSVFTTERHVFSIDVTVTTDIDCILVPFIHTGYGSPSWGVFSGSGGGPQFISGVGYSHGTTCKAFEPTLISISYEYSGFIANFGNIGFYRNINGINDVTTLNINLQNVKVSAHQL